MTEAQDLIGKKIGKVKILEKLGYGKTSSIFKAYYEPLQKEVAVKVLKEDMQASAEIRTKFLNEAKALAKLDHENIVKVFDVVEESGYLCIIMELLEGRDLYRILRKKGPFDPELAVRTIAGAAHALEGAHRQKIVHRDVKPHNLMLVGQKQKLMLVDFGLAGEGAVTGKAGTPHYMSPEQIQGKRIDEKSDIYSLGATLFHLLTGAPPYNEKTRKAILQRHLDGKLPSVSAANPELEIPKALDPVVKRMMAPVPGYRYSATDLASALGGLNLKSRPRTRARAQTKTKTKTKTRQTRRGKAKVEKKKAPIGLLIGAGVVILLVVGLLVVLVTSGSKEPVQPLPMNTKKAGEEKAKGLTVLDRAKAKENRDAMAKKAFEQAKMFADRSPNVPGIAIQHYGKVWEEYGDTHWGEKARALLKEAEARRDATKIAEENSAKASAQVSARKKLDEDLKKTLSTYDFAGAKKTLKAYFFDFEEKKSLVELHNRLEYAAQLLPMLAEEINLNEKKYDYSIFKDGVSRSAVVTGADAEQGVIIKEGSLEQRVAWGKVGTEAIRRMAERQLGYKDPVRLYILANFLFAAGEKDQFSEWLQQAKGLDRFGQIEQMEKKVKK